MESLLNFIEANGAIFANALIFGFFPVAVAVIYTMNRRRKEALKNAAISIGWQYQDSDTIDDLPRSMPRVITDVLSGKLNEKFDGKVFGATIGSGKSKRTINAAVLILKEGHVPRFTLGPENFITRLGEHLGFEDIDFENAPEFSSQYFLRGEDKQGIRKFLEGSAINYFTTNKGWTVESSGKVITVTKFKTIKAEEISRWIDELRQMANAFRN